MKDIFKKRLDAIDWEFPDYVSTSYSNDINSLHWYPATFVPQIPSILIQMFSKEGDILLEPFLGSGTTIIEAIKLGRKPIGIDLNPYSIAISKAKLEAIAIIDEKWAERERQKLTEVLSMQIDIKEVILKYNINEEVYKWFEEETLKELISIYEYIVSDRDVYSDIRKIIFSSILNKCCSQRDHYTYIIDRCFPKEFKRVDAISKYKTQLENINNSACFFQEQYYRIHKKQFELSSVELINGNSTNLNWLADSSIDIIVTSPPYLGVTDYIRSYYLTGLFFPETKLNDLILEETGARRKRYKKTAFEDYLRDMTQVFKELNRVLKPEKYLCLVIGQSSGRVAKDNLIDIFLNLLTEDLGFELIFKKARKIKFRRIQVAGIGHEWIIVLKSKKK